MSTDGQRKKILYVVTQGNWGGAQKYVFDLAVNLKDDYEVSVASGTEDHDLPDALKKQGVPYIPLPHLKRAISPWHDALAVWELYRLIRKLRPAIVHLNSSKAGAIGSIAAKLAGKTRAIFTMHGLVLTEPLSPIVKLLYTIAEKLSSYCKDILIAVSEADKRAALDYKLKPADKIIVIHNGLDFAKLHFRPHAEARKELERLILVPPPPWRGRSAEGGGGGEDLGMGEISNKKIIGTIADFYPTKGLRYLIQAARRVCAREVAAIFLLIGRGDPAPLKRMIAAEGLESKFFIIPSPPSAASYLKAFDLFALPSVKEGLPYTLLEACAAEIPIVATTVGGIPEVVENGISAVLVPPADSHALATAIETLLQHPEKTAATAAAARARLAHFSLERMIAETKKIYELPL